MILEDDDGRWKERVVNTCVGKQRHRIGEVQNEVSDWNGQTTSH